MKKSDVIDSINHLIINLEKHNEKELATPVRQHNNGGIYWLRELKFQIEKMK